MQNVILVCEMNQFDNLGWLSLLNTENGDKDILCTIDLNNYAEKVIEQSEQCKITDVILTGDNRYFLEGLEQGIYSYQFSQYNNNKISTTIITK